MLYSIYTHAIFDINIFIIWICGVHKEYFCIVRSSIEDEIKQVRYLFNDISK